MGDDDKPFACLEPGCGMRFANEDHLSVHRQRHDMSLSLTTGLGGGKSTANLLFVDQTPTPTKFLRNCEEIGLFSDLNKNPFEEAFKKATESLSEGKTDTLQIPGPSNESDTLHTPTPHIILTAAHKESPLARRTVYSTQNAMASVVVTTSVSSPIVSVPSSQEPEYIPLPGPPPELGSTISKMASHPSTASLASESDLDSQSSDMSVPRKATTPVLPSPTTPTRSLSGFVLPPKKAMLANTREQMRIRQEAASAASTVDLSYIKKESVTVAPPVVVAPTVISPQVSPAVLPSKVTSPVAVSTPVRTTPTMSPLLLNHSPMASVSASPVVSPIISTSPAVVDSKPSQYLLQVMIQMPGGEMVPVHIPAAVANTSPGVQQPATVGMTTPVAMPTTTAITTSTGSGLASSLTKQKLKAAIQQNSAHLQQLSASPSLGSQGNMRIMTEAVDRITQQQTHRQGRVSITSPSTSNSMKLAMSPPMSMVSSDSESSMSLTLEDADTSTPSKRSRRVSTEGDDPDDRRKKFLERNRAAAARCRQKKKAWIGNLETKAEELQATNVKLQNEVTLLRSEVAQLKALLLAHKDCPITLQQQSTGQLDLQTVPQMETQSDSISSTSPSTIAMETTSSSPEAIATSALTTMATKGLGGQPSYAPIQIINIQSLPGQNQGGLGNS